MIGTAAMRKANVETFENYIAAQPGHVQAGLNRLRNAIRRAVPKATESISYGMPTYKLNGRTLLNFSVWKQHYALYGATDPVLSALGDELSMYDVRKGTIRFPISEPLPVELVARIVKIRAQQFAKRPSARSA